MNQSRDELEVLRMTPRNLAVWLHIALCPLPKAFWSPQLSAACRRAALTRLEIGPTFGSRSTLGPWKNVTTNGWYLLREHMARRESRLILAYAVIVGIGAAVLGFICFSDSSLFVINTFLTNGRDGWASTDIERRSNWKF